MQGMQLLRSPDADCSARLGAAEHFVAGGVEGGGGAVTHPASLLVSSDDVGSRPSCSAHSEVDTPATHRCTCLRALVMPVNLQQPALSLLAPT